MRNERNLIYASLAFKDDGKARDVRILGMRLLDAKEMYLQNAFVCLASAKRFGVCDVALVTNCELPDVWRERYKTAGVKVYICPFEYYNLVGYNWELAFYKLRALDFVKELRYDNYVSVDADVVFLRDPSPVFEECDSGSILMYEVLHDIRQPMRRLINDNYNRMNSDAEARTISQYGGEFIAASRTELSRLSANVKKYYDSYTKKGGGKQYWR